MNQLRQMLKRFLGRDSIEDDRGSYERKATGRGELNLACEIYSIHDWAAANDFPISTIAAEETGTVRTALFPIIPEYEITLPPVEIVKSTNVLLGGRRMAAIATKRGPARVRFSTTTWGSMGVWETSAISNCSQRRLKTCRQPSCALRHRQGD